MKMECSVDNIAQICHNANYAFSNHINGTENPAWEYAPENIRESARAGVRAVLADSNLDAEGIHQKWVDYKIADGWVYGPEKSLENKTHPDLVPFNELSQDAQFKDILFITIVRTFQALATE